MLKGILFSFKGSSFLSFVSYYNHAQNNQIKTFISYIINTNFFMKNNKLILDGLHRIILEN
jgi:hypothetical protein